MGKFDGMDPELVRDLLSEVGQAAKQMRAVEGRVTQLMSGAGLSSQSTHRPSQIADACEVMVRDVSARVALLEKKIKHDAGSPAEPKAGEARLGEPKAEDSKPGSEQESKQHTPKVEDLKPAVPKGEGGPPSHDQPSDGHAKSDPKPDSAHDSKTDSNPRDDTGSDSRQDVKNDTGSDVKDGPGSKGDETSPREGGSSDAGGDGSRGEKISVNTVEPGQNADSTGDPDAKDDSGSKGDETSPREGGSSDAGGDGSRGEKISVNTVEPGQNADSTGNPDVKDDSGSKGDERSPRDGGAEILDTARKDHPDDIDQTGDMRPRVVAVDGVQVLQVPLDSPTAAEVSELLKHIEDIPPLEMPATDGVSDTIGASSGQVDPIPVPLGNDYSDVSIPDTIEPAEGQTIQPPGTGGEAGAHSAGAPPGGGQTPSAEVAAGKSAAPWAHDGTDVVSVQVDRPSADALRTLTDNVRDIEPMDMPSVRVPDGERWGEGAWTPMDVGPDGPAGDVDPGDPSRPIPPPGGRSGGQ
ncbi:hypothetical protein ACQPYK_09210 [Streptosporangium sp. CA-135522]|uniref:hypothetical protein n=1 Tax=Streptosporangium sp. CA-135522 TaxID=3240072 RepID=UPI003D92BEF6